MMVRTMRQQQGMPCECGKRTRDGVIVDCAFCIGDWLGGRARIKARAKEIEVLWDINDPDKVRARRRRARRK